MQFGSSVQTAMQQWKLLCQHLTQFHVELEASNLRSEYPTSVIVLAMATRVEKISKKKFTVWIYIGKKLLVVFSAEMKNHCGSSTFIAITSISKENGSTCSQTQICEAREMLVNSCQVSGCILYI